jgi:hypothetical protein
MNRYRIRVFFPRGGSACFIEAGFIEAANLQDAADKCSYWRAVLIQRILPKLTKEVPCL